MTNTKVTITYRSGLTKDQEQQVFRRAFKAFNLAVGREGILTEAVRRTEHEGARDKRKRKAKTAAKALTGRKGVTHD
jgi:ribosomal protein S21